MNAKLIVKGVEFPLIQNQSLPITLAIADVRSPEKRNSSKSMPFDIPETQEVNTLFEHIYNVNVALSTFNPNLKTSAYYAIGNDVVIDGDLQLLRIKINGDTGKKIYECNLIGRNGSLFISLANKLITGNPVASDDLDFSTYNHVLNKTNVVNSWATSNMVAGVATGLVAGQGYRYGLIDYGNNGNNNTEYHVKHLRPEIFKREILLKIFQKAGKTWTSTFLDSANFKSEVIPSTEGNIKISNTDQANSQFYARRSTLQTGATDTLSLNSPQFQMPSASPGVLNTVLFNEDNIAPYHDAGAQYNPANGEFTVGVTNTYNLNTILTLDMIVTNSAGTAVTFVIAVGSNVKCLIEKWDGTTFQHYANATTLLSYTPTSLTVTDIPLSLSLPNILLTAGERYRVTYTHYTLKITLKDAANANVTTGTTTVRLDCKINSNFYNTLNSTEITEGYTVEMNQTLPTNFKQIDFFKAIIQEHFLYIDVDKNNSNNYIIEPREDFYLSTYKDWSAKRDISKEEEVIPLGELDSKKYVFTNKQDSDFWNSTYFKDYKEPYGHWYNEVTNEFIKNENKIELPFSPTPLIGNDVNGLRIPKIYKNDNGTITTQKANVRSLYYGGLVNLSHGSWTLKSASGDTVYTNYPYTGHLDHPYSPSYDLNWHSPKMVYYNQPYGVVNYTSNGLYNRRYSKYMNQISDKNSKLVKRWYNLTSLDIHAFNFREPIYDNDSYYIVNKIINYDCMNPKSTQVELLRLATFSSFVPASIIINSSAERVSTNSTGTNNTNLGTDSRIAGGSNNFISAGARGVELINCTGVVVNSDVVGFIGTGLTNRTITSADNGRNIDAFSYTNRLRRTTVTASFTVDGSFDIYHVDCSATAITAIFDMALVKDYPIIFKRMDGTANVFNIRTVSGTGTYDGNPIPHNLGLGLMGKVKVYSDGTNLFSIE